MKSTLFIVISKKKYVYPQRKTKVYSFAVSQHFGGLVTKLLVVCAKNTVDDLFFCSVDHLDQMVQADWSAKWSRSTKQEFIDQVSCSCN
jgi:hypothetical protein